MSITSNVPRANSDGATGEDRRARRKDALRNVALLLARYEIGSIRRYFEEFERDILLPILLGEIALHNIGMLEHRNGAHGDEAEEGPGREVGDVPCRLKPCNAYSIAAATGLPRETVRRKINRLVELGWIRKRHNGHLYVTSKALDHFARLLCSRELPELLETADRARQLLKD